MCFVVSFFFMSQNQKRRRFFLNICHLFNQFCFLFSEVYTHLHTDILTRWRNSKASWLTCSNNVDNVLQCARMKLFAMWPQTLYTDKYFMSSPLSHCLVKNVHHLEENVSGSAPQYSTLHECHITLESNLCCGYEYDGIAEGIRTSITIMPIMTVRSIFLSSITAIMRSSGPKACSWSQKNLNTAPGETYSCNYSLKFSTLAD